VRDRVNSDSVGLTRRLAGVRGGEFL